MGAPVPVVPLTIEQYMDVISFIYDNCKHINDFIQLLKKIADNAEYKTFVDKIDGKKYIDYDLDLRVFPDGSFKVLDRGEYKYHKSIMNYPEKVDIILKEELTNLINQVRNKEGIFSPGIVEEYCKIYKENEV